MAHMIASLLKAVFLDRVITSRDLGLTLSLYVVASLHMALYDNYLCLVLASNKQQIKCKEVKEAIGNLEIGNT